MQFSLTDQSFALTSFIPAYKKKPLSFTNHINFPERVTARSLPFSSSIADLHMCNVDFLFNYHIFPTSIMRFAAEWQATERPMREGDVIVQQITLPPLRISIKCIFAVRVLAIRHSGQHMSFQYGTLEGHPERGISEFAVTLTRHNIHISIQTFSQPGNRLSQIVGPFFTLPYQQYCTNRALEYMAAAFIQTNPGVIARKVL